jgi:hypothetical protein
VQPDAAACSRDENCFFFLGIHSKFH